MHKVHKVRRKITFEVRRKGGEFFFFCFFSVLDVGFSHFVIFFFPQYFFPLFCCCCCLLLLSGIDKSPQIQAPLVGCQPWMGYGLPMTGRSLVFCAIDEVRMQFFFQHFFLS